jgi:uncharacterized membrane protein YiaA
MFRHLASECLFCVLELDTGGLDMRRYAGGFWIAVMIFAAICFYYAAMKITWKYNGIALAERLDRLEKQVELIREIILVGGVMPADSDIQKKWDKIFAEGKDGR